jgi:hypothetical protein
VGTLMRRREKLRMIRVNFDIVVGRAVLRRSFDVTIGRAACEACFPCGICVPTQHLL